MYAKEKELISCGYDPDTFNESDRAEIIVRKDKTVHYWRIIQTEIAPGADIDVSAVTHAPFNKETAFTDMSKICFIVMCRKNGEKADFEIFDSEKDARQFIQDESEAARKYVSQQKRLHVLRSYPDGSTDLHAPNTDINFSWQIIPSNIDIHNMKYTQTPSQVFIVMHTKDRNTPFVYNAFTTEHGAQLYVLKALDATKEELIQAKHNPEPFFYGNGSADLYVNANLQFSWKIFPLTVFP